jgi:hypothetical protein
MLTTDIDRQAVEKIYGRWAPVYDLVFGAVFERVEAGGDCCQRAHRGPDSRCGRGYRHLPALLFDTRVV